MTVHHKRAHGSVGLRLGLNPFTSFCGTISFSYSVEQSYAQATGSWIWTEHKEKTLATFEQIYKNGTGSYEN